MRPSLPRLVMVLPEDRRRRCGRQWMWAGPLSMAPGGHELRRLWLGPGLKGAVRVLGRQPCSRRPGGGDRPVARTGYRIRPE